MLRNALLLVSDLKVLFKKAEPEETYIFHLTIATGTVH